MATLRDVAKLSGVSPATVTHVLRNRTRNMTPETRQRVLHAVRTLGYRPGAVPQGAHGDRSTRTLGVFVWLEPESPLLNNPYAMHVLDGILSVSLARQWNVTLFSVTAWDDAHSQLRQFADGRCDGFLLIAPPPSIEIPDALRERGYPFVLINSGANDATTHTVDIDNRAAARELTSSLIAAGHRQIGFLPGEEFYENTQERVQGFLEAFAQANLPTPTSWILRPGTYHYEQSRKRVMDMLTYRESLPIPERLTALICGNDKLALCAREAFAERNITVPQEISLAGFDDTHYATEMTPPLTSVHQPLHDLGARAAEILLSLLTSDTNTLSIIKEYLPYTIIHRESIRPL